MKKFDKRTYGSGQIAQDLAFVVVAINANDPRSYMNFLYVDKENRAIANDGRRIHIAEFEELDLESESYYEVIKNSKAELWLDKSNYSEQYPNWQRAIPKEHEKICELSLAYDSSLPASVSEAIFEIARKTKKLFNIKYLIDILQTGGTWELWDDGKDGTSIMLKSDNKTAVLMPIKI